MSTMHTIVTEMANIGPKMSGKLKGYDDMEKIVGEDDKPDKTEKTNPFGYFLSYITEKVSSLRKITLTLMMVVICLAILCLALIVALGISAGRMPVTLTHVAPFGCASSHCMKRAAEMEESMDRSAKPCDDFFEYSCGGWRARTAIPPGEPEITVKLAIDNQIREKLTDYLESPVVRNYSNSAERKIKLLFKSCLNDYEKTRQGSNPLLKIMEEALGNWYVFDDNHLGNWNLQSALENIQSDYRVEALVKVEVKDDEDIPDKKAVTITSSALTMWSYWYTSEWSRAVQIRDDFQKLMRTVATLLCRDFNLTLGDPALQQRIDTFVTDVFTFERDLANISKTSPYSSNRYDDEERVSLTELKRQTNNFIDWPSFFQYMFTGAGITGNTKVVIQQKDYVIRMADYVNNLGQNKTRILNNYLTWRLAYAYLQDLSWEYVHANRQFYVDRTGRAEFLGTWRYCFNYVSRSMNVALSHLFIQDHFADDNKKKVHEIASYVKQSLVDHVADFKWMDDKTRTYARNKVQAIVDKLGYPDFMMNPQDVDRMYSTLEINETDYFQNVLNINKLYRTDWTNLLRDGEDRTKWRGNTYATFAQFYYPWNELLVPAGILQWPIYDYHIPHFLNFGSMGSVIAHMYVHSIDYNGAFYQINGSLLRGDDGKYIRWWSNATTFQYTDARKCFVDYYTNKTLGPYTVNGRKLTVPAKATSFAGEGALEVGGLKQAYYGYKKWEVEHGGEPMAPGLGLTNDQMFFLAYAQTWCFVRNDITAYQYAMRGQLPENMKVNTAVSQMKEFSDAFKCPVNSPMNPQKKCSIW